MALIFAHDAVPFAAVLVPCLSSVTPLSSTFLPPARTFASGKCQTRSQRLSHTSDPTYQLLTAPLIPLSLYCSDPDHILLTMPALSPTMEKGNLVKWLKQPGDEINPGDSMADVETDKATVAFESVEAGFMAKILVQDGSSDVVVGTPVAVLAENKEDVDKFKDFTGDGTGGGGDAEGGKKVEAQDAKVVGEKTATPKQGGQADAGGEKDEQSSADLDNERKGDSMSTSSSSGGSSQTGDRIIASPAAKRIAGEKGVSLEGLKGTGPDGRIVSADVTEAMESGSLSKATATKAPAAPAAGEKSAAKPAPKAAAAPAGGAAEYTDLPLSNIRKVIAQRLLQSKTTIPHYYLTQEVNVDQLMKLRAELNSRTASEGVKLSVNDFIVKAAALACRKVPAANSSWQDSVIRQFNYVDMSVAVSTDSGLITPIVKDADIKGLAAISSETKDLAKRARDNKLKPEEFQGGTFTISNLGMFGTTQFAAIINPPQSCILAIGGATGKVVKVGAEFQEVQVMNVTLSCDHRVVDGAVGAQWLQAFKGYIENPVTMLL